MKVAFDTKLRLQGANKKRLGQINAILEEYVADGFVLTLRQLYYQLVSRGIIENKIAEYRALSNLLKKGRMAGVVDWDAIEDRVRKPKLPYYVLGIKDALQDTIDQYRLNRMRGQPKNIELWVEKDALSAIFERVTRKYHIRLMVNRGYSSVSAMYDAHKRLMSGDVILYFGDHDPSGLDMIRDVRERLMEFGRMVEVRAVALTWEQVQQYNPPPNPAKFEDPRAEWYIERYGEISWELDALPPRDLMELAEKEILSIIDLPKWEAMVAQEKADVKLIRTKFDMPGPDDESGDGPDDDPDDDGDGPQGPDDYEDELPDYEDDPDFYKAGEDEDDDGPDPDDYDDNSDNYGL